jgi:hypothetical protein
LQFAVSLPLPESDALRFDADSMGDHGFISKELRPDASGLITVSE